MKGEDDIATRSIVCGRPAASLDEIEVHIDGDEAAEPDRRLQPESLPR
jgi:hypothetical protein